MKTRIYIVLCLLLSIYITPKTIGQLDLKIVQKLEPNFYETIHNKKIVTSGAFDILSKDKSRSHSAQSSVSKAQYYNIKSEKLKTLTELRPDFFVQELEVIPEIK